MAETKSLMSDMSPKTSVFLKFSCLTFESEIKKKGIAPFKPGPIGSKSSLHGFAVCSNSCFYVARLWVTCSINVRGEEECFNIGHVPPC